MNVASSEAAQVDAAKRRVIDAASTGRAGEVDVAVCELLVSLNRQVVQAHIGIVRRCCGSDQVLAVRIANALCELNAGQLQRWAAFSGRQGEGVEP